MYPTNNMNSLISSLSQILGAGMYQNPYESGMEYADMLPETISPYYDPYINQGMNAMNILFPEYQSLLNNPAEMLSQMGGDIYGTQFQQSPGYEFQYNQAMNAANNSAAAGGMLGSPAHTAGAQQSAAQIANQDYYNYLNNQMNINRQGQNLYGMGLSGLGNINQMGYNASDTMAQLLAQNLMQQARLATYGAMGNNSRNGGLLGGITGLVGGLF